ncbi:hypothetical protein A3A71_01590 [Candidatus Berkelbacteria bacterium RIFCSPLOWO2_01_FULL_50_28]|uniref:Glycerate kinase n=1 Tax=Candidatus Berkelbacteria bacterium RIFCSPLOWO2_01_FULL_50_28 TaxID=1797471 RepID=A0A1F5EBE2_9BACT|nr:MAG: hypothetical protein A3F39_03035 [Candidatus Berkelbacteria bacterium RIFCSPHIGHO2_12_FULL_50_11]OGD64727.1 MAG: hypothetical protein A3A71_01590 [Candidatus Berkelbacteria bacterium RIFCSPLOWO2_01_FULL_50_28]
MRGNFDLLATNPLRKDALKIIEAGLEGIDTAQAVNATVQIDKDNVIVSGEKFALQSDTRVIVIGVGKCSFQAAEKLENILGDRLTTGLVIGIDDKLPATKKITAILGSHPHPTEGNIAATEKMVSLLHDLRENDLVIVLVSGGGSTLLCMPESHSCVEEGMILNTLTKAGATIQEINTLRKHMSLARGGFLARHAYPARVVGLIFSDVIGNDLQFIASGPTVKDETSVEQAEKILEKYDILQSCRIDHCGLIETPKEDRYFANAKNLLLVTNNNALKKMAETAAELGYRSEICDSCLTGEASKLGAQIATDLHDSSPKTARLYGGETTVTIKGPGKGGRNQELALGALSKIREGEIIVAINSDGWDNTSAAGALADTDLAEQVVKKKLNIENFLRSNNSFEFFAKTNSHLITGHTGSNISDLVLALKG